LGAGPSGPVFIRDPDHLKLPLEELHATEANGFSDLIEAELRKLEWRDLTIWRVPLWWFGLPAAPKGWVDRVSAMGRSYGGGHIYETGVFRGKSSPAVADDRRTGPW
jgi:NAD(P)H dehydrogenase (quinone)